MIKTFFIVLLSLLEIPFFVKFLNAHRNFEIIREIAIVVIMLLVAIGIYLLVVM